jgi:hypothetical protein
MGYALNGPANVGVVVGANATVTQSFTINDRKFQTLALMFTATSALMLLNIRIRNRNVFASSVLIGTVAGNIAGFFPVPILPGMLTFEPRETVQVDYTDISGFANTIYLSFVGREHAGA